MKILGAARVPGVVVGLAILGATQAGAQGTPGRLADWSFEISPYLWMAGLDGTIQPVAGGPTFQSSLSFGDILENLDAGFFLSGSARRDRFVILGDLYYISASDTVRTPRLAPITSIRGEAEILQGTLAAGWRAVDRPTYSLDLLAGVRAGENRIEVQARAGDTTVRQVRDDITYAAPILGVRGRVALSDRVSVTGYGDFGGGTSSVDSTWQLSATIDYHLSDRAALSVGYRHESLDIDNDGARSNTDTSGFLVGTRLRF
jgi:hypothetical protein